MSEDVRHFQGRPSRGWIVAPNFTIVKEMWRYVNSNLKEIIVDRNKSEKLIVLAGGHEIEFKSADNKDENLRGAGLDWAIFDEAARCPKAAWEQGVRPALAERRGRALFISTPKGRNWFHDLYAAGQDPNQNLFQSWKLPSNTNPYFPQDEWDELQRTLPEMVFRQEFMADFLEDGSTVFRGLNRCISGDFEDAIAGHEYVLGVDLAKTYDFTVIWILDMTTKHFVYFDRFQDIDWPLQKEKIYWKAREYNNALVSIDSTGVGDPIESDLRRAGLRVEGFKFNIISKKELVELGILAIEQRWISFPETPEFLNEMMAFEYEILPSGRIRYNAPDGLHDDTVMAFLLALWPLRSRFYPHMKAIDKNAPPTGLDERSYEFWVRHQTAKKQSEQNRADLLEGMT